MGVCRDCGQEIIFRHIDGKVRPIHPYGCPCGERPLYSDDSLKRSVHTRCPKCQKMVYLVRHNGGSVWLDELGWPWPKHPCFEREPDQGWKGFGSTTTTPVYEEYDRIARFSKRCEFCKATIKFSRYAAHIKHCSQRGRSNYEPELGPASRTLVGQAHRDNKTKKMQQTASCIPKAPATSSDGKILTRCEFCKARIKPNRYPRHLRKAHCTTVAVPNPSSTPGQE